MKSDLIATIENYIAGWRHKQLWYKAVTCMAAVVVFCTTYALILPAITMEKDCTLPEHTHTDECYSQVTALVTKTPICTVSAPNSHLHTADCFDADGAAVCGFDDPIVHQHDENCYTADGELWCQIPELALHIHDTACYEQPADETAEPELVCTEHEHSADCFEQNKTLICELPDGDTEAVADEAIDEFVEEAIDESADEATDTEVVEADPAESHYHNDDCYLIEDTQVCGYESDHTHSEECYATPEPAEPTEPAEPLLICGEAELLSYTVHQHTDVCFEITEQPLDTTELTCTNPDHEHTERCYGVWELSCGMQEHTHGDNCVTKAEPDALPTEPVPEQPEQPEQPLPADAPLFSQPPTPAELDAAISTLPTPEEIAATLTAFEDADDTEGMEAYYRQAYLSVMNVYVYWEEMTPEQQAQVANAEQLCQLADLFSGYPQKITDTLTVYQINKYSQAQTLLIYGDTVQKILNSNMSFTYWQAVVVEKKDSGQLYVAKNDKEAVSKQDYKAETADGFVLLIYTGDAHNIFANINEGDIVEVSFNYKNTTGTSSSGYGMVSFTTPNVLTTTPGADTDELIEVNLYDYGSNINKNYETDKKYPGFQQDEGQKGVSSTASSNFGNNITADLAAGKESITDKGGDINKINPDDRANKPISGAMLTTLKDGYPALADGTSLKYLFSNGTYATKKNEKSINGLFIYDDNTGAYTFNSRKNHAQFNPDDDTFTLYEQIITSNVFWYPFGNFLPFNDIVTQCTQASAINRDYIQTIAASAQAKYNGGSGSEYNTLYTALTKFISLMDEAYPKGWGAAQAINDYFNSKSGPGDADKTDFDFAAETELLNNIYSIDFDEATDFYFGMEMKMNFMQPKGGLTGKDGKQPMVFYFTGDDDVWVYIDNTLFLDLSGIHRHVGGEIDFVNGEVKYYGLDVNTGDVATTPYKTVEFSELVDAKQLNDKGTFVDYSQHSFNFYYMERGAGSGVCRMNFNFPLLRKNSISVTKELDTDDADKLDTLLGNPDFRFQVMKENGTDLFIPANTSYDIMDSAGNKIGAGTTDTNGVFKIKANQTAVFTGIPENSGKYFVRELLDAGNFAQYGTITVDGTSQTTNYDVTIGSDSFKGVNSPVKDVSDGSTSFHFKNHIDWDKLGSLSITKELADYPNSRAAKQFSFNVTLDDKPLPVDTAYTVGSDTRTVTEEGIITIAPGETAIIGNILAGTTFTVEETQESAEGYTVSYKLDGKDVSGDKATGTINVESKVAVTVINQETGTSVEIPVQKILNFPDGVEHEYTLRLQEVDSNGNTLEGGYTQDITVKITNDRVSDKFTVGYATADLEGLDLPQTYYYEISEIAKAEDITTDYDRTWYIVEVTVSETETGAQATITKRYKADGTELTELTEGETLTFTNSIIRPELPSTGGCGTYVYTLAGTALIGAATHRLYKKRKREVQQTP